MKVAEQKALCPVQPGDIWAIGPHLWGCGDLEDGRVLARLLELAKPLTMVYADPPWTSSNATWYRSLSERDGGKGRKTDWRTVWRLAVEPARSRRIVAYCEMGQQNRAEAMSFARSLGARCDTWSEVHYPWTTAVVFPADFRRPAGEVCRFDDPWGWQPDHAWLTSGHVEPSAQALAAHEPGVMLDPCSGEGYTARSAVHAGWTFVGHEITPRRMWMALRRIAPESEHRLVERVS